MGKVLKQPKYFEKFVPHFHTGLFLIPPREGDPHSGRIYEVGVVKKKDDSGPNTVVFNPEVSATFLLDGNRLTTSIGREWRRVFPAIPDYAWSTFEAVRRGRLTLVLDELPVKRFESDPHPRVHKDVKLKVDHIRVVAPSLTGETVQVRGYADVGSHPHALTILELNLKSGNYTVEMAIQ